MQVVCPPSEVLLPRLEPVRDKVKALGLEEQIIPFSVAFETHLMSMSAEEAQAYCEEHKVKSVLPKIIVQGYHTLNLIHFFTAGPDEVKSWTIKVCGPFLLSFVERHSCSPGCWCHSH